MGNTIKDFLHIEGKWFKFWIDEFDGKTHIDLKIRPLFPEVYLAITKAHVNRKSKKKKCKIKGIDWEGLSNDAINYILEDFRGVGTDYDRPLEITPENKKKVLELSLKYKGQTILDFMFVKAAKLGGIKYG